MHNALNPLQIALVMLMGVAMMMAVTTLCRMAGTAIKRIRKGSNSEILFEDLHKVLSENEISYQQTSKQLNDYQS